MPDHKQQRVTQMDEPGVGLRFGATFGPGVAAASTAFTPTAVGDYWWYASFPYPASPADADNNAANTACNGSMSELVVMYQPTLAFNSPPTTGTLGTAVTAASLASTLTSGGMPTTSAVSYAVYGASPTFPTTCQTTTGGLWTALGSGTPNGSGVSSPTTGFPVFSPALAGDYWWYASFPGDSNKLPANSACDVGTMPKMAVPMGVGTLASTGSAASALTATISTVPAAGTTLLVLVYAKGTAAPSITAVGGNAFSATPTPVTSAAPGGNYGEWAYVGTAAGGANNQVTATLNASTSYVHVDVVSFTGDNTATPVAQSDTKNSTSNGTTATAILPVTPPAGDTEVALVGVASAETSFGSTAWTTIGATPGAAVASYYTTSAGSTSQNFTFSSTAAAWATISVDIGA